MPSIKKLFTVLLLSSVISLSQASQQGSNNSQLDCLKEAKKHLFHNCDIATDSEFDMSSYKLTIAEGDFLPETSTLYTFSRSITDTWEIELLSFDCFPVRIEFIGDL